MNSRAGYDRFIRQRQLVSRSLSLLVLLAMAPLLIVVGLLVLVCDGTPVCFRHTRVGRNGATFQMIKFRTMRGEPSSESLQITAGDDSRISRLGHWLRRYRFDELPQLINVLRGEMNLVGPRPESPAHAVAYKRQAARMHALTPGITDPGTLFFLYRETELITGAQEPTDIYLRCVMPLRNRMSIEYSRNATVADDLLVLAATLLAIASPSAARPMGLGIMRRSRRRAAILSPDRRDQREQPLSAATIVPGGAKASRGQHWRERARDQIGSPVCGDHLA